MSRIAKIKTMVLGVFLSIVMLSAASGKVLAAPDLRCIIGSAVVDCADYRETISAANFNPADTNKCYYFTQRGVEQQDCSTYKFAVLGGMTVNEAIKDKAQQGATDALAAQAENPEQIDCNDAESCLTNNPLVLIITIAIQVMSAAVGVIVVIMIVIGGIQYTTAGGNPNATSAAKKRILNAVLALVAWAFLFVFFQWLIPGGVF